MEELVMAKLNDEMESEELTLVLAENEILTVIDLYDTYTYMCSRDLTNEELKTLNEIHQKNKGNDDSLEKALIDANFEDFHVEICDDYQDIQELRGSMENLLVEVNGEIEQSDYTNYDFLKLYKFWDGSNHKNYFLNEDFTEISRNNVSLDEHDGQNFCSGSNHYHEQIHSICDDNNDYEYCLSTWSNWQGSLHTVDKWFNDIQEVEQYLKACEWIHKDDIENYIDQIKSLPKSKLNGKNTMKKNIFMFDVESDGLYGKGFCFSAVVSDKKGNIIDSLTLKTDIKISVDWVKENVMPNLKGIKTVESLEILRNEFYNFYLKYKDCNIYSDCNYPVETNFLSDVAKDNLTERQFNMPYPLMDVCNFVDSSIDREKYYTKYNASYIIHDVASRKPKQHNPYYDCLCSIFVLLHNKNKIKNKI